MPDGSLTIVVTDTGIGIEEENLPLLVQPFYQVQSDSDRQYEGTGLGLSIVNSLAKLHGANLEVRLDGGKRDQAFPSSFRRGMRATRAAKTWHRRSPKDRDCCRRYGRRSVGSSPRPEGYRVSRKEGRPFQLIPLDRHGVGICMTIPGAETGRRRKRGGQTTLRRVTALQYSRSGFYPIGFLHRTSFSCKRSISNIVAPLSLLGARPG